MDNGLQDSCPTCAGPSGPNRGKRLGEICFQVFCATIFLGMIGLVFINALLATSSGPASRRARNGARFLFLYITFFGAIEAFYRNRHIAVEMVVSKLRGATRKTVDIVASLLTMFSWGCFWSEACSWCSRPWTPTRWPPTST
jgi:TRAP-type C4-dicarboxylate transport system permease small subunit